MLNLQEKFQKTGVEKKLQAKVVITRTKFHLTACDAMTALDLRLLLREVPDDAIIDEFYEDMIECDKFLVIVFHHEMTEQ